MSTSLTAYIVSRDLLAELGKDWGVYVSQDGLLARETANVILGAMPPTAYLRLSSGTINNGLCYVIALENRIPSEVLEQLDELFECKPRMFIREKNARRWYDGSDELWTGDTLTYVA
jgi:hypothetical protein